MSKKMKRVAFDSLPYGVYEDAKTRFKHQTLLQDYRELEKETESMSNKLENMKQRKSTLLAEVRFLRRRHKYLLKTKSSNPPQERLVKPRTSEIQPKNVVKERIYSRKESTLQNLPSISGLNQKEKKASGKKVGLRNPPQVFDINQKRRTSSGKKVVIRNPPPVFDINQKEKNFGAKKVVLRNPPPVFYTNQKEKIYSGKEPFSIQNRTPIIDLNQNQNERVYGGKESIFQNPAAIFDLAQKERVNYRKEAALRNPAPVLDLNQKGRTYSGKEAAVLKTRAPVFDLNQISREEEDEEFQDSGEPSRNEEKMKSLSRGGSDEQSNDLKLSLCRSVGSGSNRAGKRKISWQDQVALRV